MTAMSFPTSCEMHRREREREREREKVFRQSVSLEVEHEGKNQHVMRLTDRNGTHNPKINIRKRAVGTNGSESMVEESIGNSDAAADGRRLPNLPWLRVYEYVSPILGWEAPSETLLVGTCKLRFCTFCRSFFYERSKSACVAAVSTEQRLRRTVV